jgi:large subunit ribosomal protein L25
MEIATVAGETRAPGGRHANERIRRRGFVPGVIYGHGEAPEPVALSRHDLESALAHQAHVIKLALDGKEIQYLLKDVQYDHLNKIPLHVDLMRVDAAECVRVKVGLEFKGTPQGTREGGIVHQVMSELEIECRVLDIPEVLRVSVSDVALNQAIQVRDIPLPPDVLALADPEAIVYAVRPKREEAAAAAAPAEGEAAAAEPEVIGRVAKETPEEGEKQK